MSKCKTLKNLEVDIGEYIYVFRVRNDFLDDIKYAWNRKRVNILTIKIKTSGQKYHTYKWKDKSWTGQRYLQLTDNWESDNI